MTIALSRRYRRRRVSVPAPAPTGCTCALRHPCSVAERKRLVDAAARARRAGQHYLAGCLAERLSTPCRTWEPAAALLAGADWLEGGAA